MWEMWQKKKSSQGGSDRRTRCWPMSNQWRLSNLVTKNFFPDPIILYLSSPSSTTGHCHKMHNYQWDNNEHRLHQNFRFKQFPHSTKHIFWWPFDYYQQLGPLILLADFQLIWHTYDMCVVVRYFATATKDWLSLLGVSRYHSARLAHFSEVSKFHLN